MVACFGFPSKNKPRHSHLGTDPKASAVADKTRRGYGSNHTTRGPQVLVLVSFARVPFWVPTCISDPHPRPPESP